MQPGGDDMDSLYGEGPASETAETPSSQPESVDQEEQETGEQTAVISNKILSPDGEPLNPGDEIVLQVVKNYGDESEVKYAPHKPGEGEGGETETAIEPGESGAADYETDLAAMDQKGY